MPDLLCSTITVVKLLALAALLLATAPSAGAQTPARTARAGVLSVGMAPSPEEVERSPFITSLRDLGWVRGQNLIFETRYADGDPDRLPAMAADLVRLKVDLIVALSSQEAQAAKRATASIPIVILFGVAPIEAGLVASLARPGGNVTGTDVGAAVAQVTRERAGALFVVPSGPVVVAIPAIIAFAAEHRIPTLFPSGRWPVDGGGLMSYGFDSSTLLRRSASYGDRILRGTRPAALPVERPTTLELAINLRTAKALGLTIPPSLLRQADHLIE